MANPATCSLCGLPLSGRTCDPGPALGVCHRSCFVAWDRRAEAEELAEAAHHHSCGPEPVREALRA